MWYEILPILGIMGFCVGFPSFFAHKMSYYIRDGKQVVRNLWYDDRDYHAFLRDQRITGHPYYQRALDHLDEEPTMLQEYNFFTR